MKILTIQFRSLGDVVLSIPALNAIRRRFPDCELHSVVPEAAAPLLQYHPSVNRVWGFPRKRGKASLTESLPMLRKLRAEHFDVSIDFAGNDRGALVSFCGGARQRWGVCSPGGFFGRRLCYNKLFPTEAPDRHEAVRLLSFLRVFGIEVPASESEIKTELFCKAASVGLFRKSPTVICHVGAGIPKKEWSIVRWAELHRLATAEGYNLRFSLGISPREQRAADLIKSFVPDAEFIPSLSLEEYLAELKVADVVISNDTGPMHFAAALGVKTIGIFGPTSVTRWKPLGEQVRIVKTSGCLCAAASHHCLSQKHCMDTIEAEMVMEQLRELSKGSKSALQHVGQLEQHFT